MYVSDGACCCRDGYAFELLYVLRFEVRIMDYQVLGYRATNAQLVGECDVHFGGTDIRQSVHH